MGDMMPFSTAPRIMVAAPASGSGKTTFSCGLMQALVNRGLAVQACKCGPDYIDPMFHREVIGAASRNLDLFLMDEELVRSLVAEGARSSDITVVEGAMGYYDGIAVSDEASAWHVARATGTPVVLVVDGRGRARSIAAEVEGFARFREKSQVAGVVLNRVSAALYPRLKELVEAECGIPVYGHVPVLEDASLESRHLGLVTAAEVDDLRGKLARLADTFEQTVDIDGLLDLARTQGDGSSVFESLYGTPNTEEPSPCVPCVPDTVIAVARDEAFCFYYDLFEKMGARVVEFSPLTDESLPEGTAGMYLGGGYPELHARELAQNGAMLSCIRHAIEQGMPTIAECGGFMYLHEELEDEAGDVWNMVGAVPGKSFRTPKLTRFGYVTLESRTDNLLAAAGDKLRAHEFHYWDSANPGSAFHAVKPQSSRAWDCVHATPTLYAGYPHLCLHAAPRAAARFVAACSEYALRKGA